ncbi:MAG TPA: hypothetical protein PKD09_13680 [Aggregatilinea sp.]|uniref:hypothetical protein n=1 Tax=Aggregatilinea sp. TaxID=2806333 RepID=UPI002CC1F437|nr:hypothetical protein [Aggregatilinea sp.]HML22697.1 hypothetical protein [Aggregatilinea sp.]
MEFEKIDITQIVVALISLAGMIWGAAQRSTVVEGPTTGSTSGTGQKTHTGAGAPMQGQPPNARLFIKNNWPSLLIGACGLIFLVNAGYALVQFMDEGDPEVAITTPADNGAAEYMQAVRGTSTHVPDDQTLWLVVVPHANNRYYPANKPVDMQISGEWASLVYFGLPETSGESFDVLAVLLDEQGRSDFEDYVNWCKTNNSWAGYDRLPAGTEVYDRITVTRG